MNSKSAELLSRLIPENKPYVNQQNGSTKNLIFKPKIVGGKTNSLLNSVSSVSKVEKLRSEIYNPQKNGRLLSNSASAALLSGTKVTFQDESKSNKNSESTKDFFSPSVSSSEFKPYISFVESLKLSEKQKHDLYKVPNTFFYLKIRTSSSFSDAQGTLRDNDCDSGITGSVYDLELLNADELDKNYYFTFSKEGVSVFRNKISQFTSLSQWEREYKLFRKMANIRFFRLYKRWKVIIIIILSYGYNSLFINSKIKQLIKLFCSNLYRRS
jgi:hypothetical protein